MFLFALFNFLYSLRSFSIWSFIYVTALLILSSILEFICIYSISGLFSGIATNVFPFSFSSSQFTLVSLIFSFLFISFRLLAFRTLYEFSSSVTSRSLNSVYRNFVYSSFLNIRNYSPDHITTIFMYGGPLMVGLIQPSLLLFSSVIPFLFLFAYLLLSFPSSTIFIVLFLFLLYFLYKSFVVPVISSLNSSLNISTQELYSFYHRILSVPFPDIFISHQQDLNIRLESRFNSRLRSIVSKIVYTASLPRYLIEGLFYILLPCYFFLLSIGVISTPDAQVSATLCLSFLRLAISLGTFISSLSVIRSNLYALTEISSLNSELISARFLYSSSPSLTSRSSSLPIGKPFLSLCSVNFRLPGDASSLFSKNISFDVYPGQKLLLTGPNSSGKSTLMQIILGIFSPSNGSVRFNGNIVNSPNGLRSGSWISDFVYISQFPFLASNRSFSSYLSSDQQLDHTLLLPLFRNLFDSSSTIHSITDILNSSLSDFSGGQKQRLILISKLYDYRINPFSILFLDESFSAIDPVSLVSIMNYLVSEFPNLSIILISHSFPEGFVGFDQYSLSSFSFIPNSI